MENRRGHRQEIDSLGKVQIDSNVAWGSQTQRAVENFEITNVPISHYPELIVALAHIKCACATANETVGNLPSNKASPIKEVCSEIAAGKHHEFFVVDVIQGGAGTSTNMNANEVIANLALQKMGFDCGAYEHLHPNDDVNRSQSTNDVYPTAIRLATLSRMKPLLGAMRKLSDTLHKKAAETEEIQKVGRTQLQDAVPMTLGSEFRGWAVTISEDIDRLGELSGLLREVNLGGTAIGTGINTPEGFAKLAIQELRSLSGEEIRSADDLIEASSDLGAFVIFSGALKRIAIKLSKICNDLRLLSSGPRAGFGEITLPSVQAGSSIMPGKVNPVIPEVVNQVCYQAIGNDLTVSIAAESGQLQLNAMEPVIIHNVLETMGTLTRAMDVLDSKCVSGIVANADRCRELLEHSLVRATELSPLIGYEASTKLAKHAQASGLSLSEAAAEILQPDIAHRVFTTLKKTNAQSGL